jgi:hypothetical protein
MIVDRRTEITVETDRVFVIRRRRSIRAWCSECGCEVDLVGEGEVEILTGMLGHTLRDRAEARGWHLCEGPDGSRLVCLESLLKAK